MRAPRPTYEGAPALPLGAKTGISSEGKIGHTVGYKWWYHGDE